MKFARAIAVLAGVVGAAIASVAAAELTVGVSMPLTGPAASLGIPSKSGLDLWPDVIGGEKVKLIVLDDVGDPTTATKNARRFVDENADVILGGITTPSTIAISRVATESQTVQLSPAPAELPDGRDPWTFRAAMSGAFYCEGIVEHMQKAGVKTIAFLGYSDALGESYLQAVTKLAPAAGIKIVSVERFTRADTSVVGQAVKIAAARPDAVLVVASGGGAALPQDALIERGYKGKIYHGSAAVSADFLRLSGKNAEGALVVSGPEQVPEQLPAGYPGKNVALAFVQQYEKKYGAGSRTQFAAHLYDFAVLLQDVVPLALKKGKPGTVEFRRALKEALETSRGVAVTKGILKYTTTDHWGHDSSARVMLVVANGTWKLTD
jgi:branched-chain amino acid transport system substrate-binding protein